jgi:hypothetical protein
LDGAQVATFEFRNAKHGGKHVAICSGLRQLPLGVPVTQVLLHIVFPVDILAENAPDWDVGAWMGTTGVRSGFYRKLVGLGACGTGFVAAANTDGASAIHHRCSAKSTWIIEGHLVSIQWL